MFSEQAWKIYFLQYPKEIRQYPKEIRLYLKEIRQYPNKGAKTLKKKEFDRRMKDIKLWKEKDHKDIPITVQQSHASYIFWLTDKLVNK